MQRIISCILTIILIISCIPIMSVSAEESSRYTVTNAISEVDDVFTVNVSIADNPGIISLRFKAIYDSL